MTLESGLFLMYILLSQNITFNHKCISLALLIIFNLLLVILMDKHLFTQRIKWRLICKNKDSQLTFILKVALPILIFITALIDRRIAFTSSHFSETFLFCFLGEMLLFIGMILFLWTIANNKFYIQTMAIQYERNHHVISDGPYHFIRHPGYLSSIILTASLPFLLDSVLAIPLCILLAAGYIAKAQIEDKVLQRHFKGYYDYTKRVKYKLLPKIW